MRALVISHTYIAKDNQAKWESLAKITDTEIELHLPHRWPSWEHEYHAVPENKPKLSIRSAQAWRTGREDQYFFAPEILRGLKNGNFDILHVEQGASAFSYTQALLERNLFSPKTKTCFFTWINWEYTPRWPWTWFEPYNLKHSDGAIGGNREAVDVLRNHGFKGKATVIPQIGVDPEFYSPFPLPTSPLSSPCKGEEERNQSPPHSSLYQGEARRGLREQHNLQGIVIGFVGRLVEEKGISLLLKAAEKIKFDGTLLFLGSGPMEKSFSEYQKKLHIVHIPAVPHDTVRDFMRAMDILVLPSFSTPKWKEQFGHVLIEAMACEVPVIGSSAAAIPDVIENAGLIFKEHSIEELAQCLNSLINSFPERQRFGKLGRERVLKKFTHDEIARQTLEFWKTL